jgi:hypothetical protein
MDTAARRGILGPDWGGFGQMSRLVEDPIGLRDEMIGAGQGVKKIRHVRR